MKAWIAIFGLALWSQTLTVQKERALGEALLRDAKRLENAEVAAYVERVGARLGGGFRVVVITGDKGEPVALPGQIVTVPAGFLLAVEDEAEFAGMLAHAMGHTALRHGIVEQPGTITLMTPIEHPPDRMLTAIRMRLPEYELAADRYGAEAAARAGYDATGLTRYLRRTKAAEERLAELPAAEGGEVSSSEFLRVRELVRAALAAPVRKAPSLRRR